MRAIKEFFNPSLKCKRIGHQEQEVVETGYIYPSRHGVAADGTRTFKQCQRCYVDITNAVYKETDWIDSLSMSSSDWKTLKENGFLKRM